MWLTGSFWTEALRQFREKKSQQTMLGKAGCPNERKQISAAHSLTPVVHSNELEMDYTSENKTKQISES